MQPESVPEDAEFSSLQYDRETASLIENFMARINVNWKQKCETVNQLIGGHEDGEQGDTGGPPQGDGDCEQENGDEKQDKLEG